MVAITILSLAFAPALFWLWYFYKKDKLEPEPLRLIRNSFLLGMACVVPAALLELPFFRASSFWGLVVVAPMVEESLKFLTVRWTVYRNIEFDEPMDGVVYGVATALGFASVENVLYLFGHFQKGLAVFATVTLIRALFTVPAHAFFASVWGYSLGFAKFSEPRRARKLVRIGLFLAILLHAAFNFCTTLGPLWIVGMLILMPLMWRITHKKIKEALAASPHRIVLTDEREVQANAPPEQS